MEEKASSSMAEDMPGVIFEEQREKKDGPAISVTEEGFQCSPVILSI
jgi:hypothetical protein